MANIVLSSKCNLNCKYCFAKDYIKSENEKFSLDNFKKAVNFIKTKEDERIGIVGGEPFLHPDFDKILDILEQDIDINNVIIFTNGIFIKKYLNKLKNNKFNLLINCNYPEDIGKDYDVLKKNLIALQKSGIKNITLGINLYSSLKNYNFIFDLLKTVNLHELRFSFAFSKEQKNNTKNIFDLYKKIKPFWLEFIEKCISEQIVPVCDCNPIPDCLLDDYDKNIAIKIMLMAKKYNTDYTLSTAKLCPPLIDIFPDLTAVRSFCYSLDEKISINKFQNLEHLREYFYNKIDVYNELTLLDKKCLNCIIRLTGRCCICPVFKSKKSFKLKKMIEKYNS
jgi:MoaA/NifB/PqqE/SkfB family radical SAM enzyme